jgi:acetylornithine/N-succinyldiaminopimelate aminotransferase
MLATDKVASAFHPGDHASTFGGNPLVCAAAVATIETLLEDGFVLDQCNRMSEYFVEKLGNLREKFPPLIADIRGLGLLLGVELTRDCAAIVKECLEMGMLINCTAEKVLRFIPPLVIQKKDIDQLMDVLGKVFGKLM